MSSAMSMTEHSMVCCCGAIAGYAAFAFAISAASIESAENLCAPVAPFVPTPRGSSGEWQNVGGLPLTARPRVFEHRRASGGGEVELALGRV
jgi:hypothetical protein